MMTQKEYMDVLFCPKCRHHPEMTIRGGNRQVINVIDYICEDHSTPEDDGRALT